MQRLLLPAAICLVSFCTISGIFADEASLQDATGKWRGEKPNVLWILIEDWSADLSCYATPLVHTPNIDKLAADGIRFEQAYTTSPVCSTSRSAMMTGFHQNYIGAHQHRTSTKKPLPYGIKPIPHLLEEAGYYTATMAGSKTDCNFTTSKKLFMGKNWRDRTEGQPFYVQATFAGTHRSFVRDPERPIDADKVKVPPYYPDLPLVRRDWANGLETVQVVDRQVGAILQQLDDDGLADNTIVFFIGDHGRCHIRGKQFLYEGGVHIPLIVRWPKHIKPGSVSSELVSTLDICQTIVTVAGASATATDPAQDLMETSGVQGGLVVHVGCGDGTLTAALRKSASYLVQGLDTDPAQVARAREHLLSRGLYGKVSLCRFDGNRLPYVDGLVNLIVADELGDVTMDEVMRVLAPRGVAIVNGKMTVKKVPAEIDDWSHHMYDASGVGAGNDTAVGQPRSMQWKAGPEYSRSHENMSSVSAVVSAGGRVFSIMDEGPKASIYLPSKWFVSGRDAFSGVLLWKVPIEEWHAGLFPLKSGPMQLPRRLVAVEDRVYVTLGIDAPVSELDAATGRVLRTFQETAHAEEVLYTDGKLVVVTNNESAANPYRGKTPSSRRGFALDEKTLNLEGSRSVALVDVSTGNLAWRTAPAPVVSTTIAADGGKAVYMSADQLVCVDLAGGKELWSEKAAPQALRLRTTVNPTILIHQGIVYAAMRGRLSARDAATGKEFWSQDWSAAGYKSPASIFIIDDLIWDVATGGEPYRPGADLKTVNRYYVGYDLRTGEERRRLPVSAEHGYAIMHHRCHVPRASGTNIITSFPGIEFFDVTSGQVTHDSWIRGACLYGFMPANGLLYTPPHPCACYMQGKLSGFWAVAGRKDLDRGTHFSKRLEKGSAYAGATADTTGGDDWGTYRGNAARSGATKAAVPVDVSEQWSVDVGRGLSQCVVADGRLFVTTVDSHTVHALNAHNGNKLWQYTAGGRVDSAPTSYAATVIFGSRDGFVYCLTADEGELVWRFRAAPADQRCVAYDQIESAWPVHGSVLIHNDVLWFCAGRSSYLDGGLYVYRLNPRTGKLLTMTKVDSLGPKDEQKPITSTIYARLDMEGAKNDVLSCDGDHVFMRHWAFDLNGKSVEQQIDHLFSPTGFLDCSWFRRTYWIYGRKYVGGAQGWARTGNTRPTGRIMSLDDERVYGFGRDQYPPSPGNTHQMYLVGEKEVFFAAERKETQEKSFLWTTPGDIQVRGMVLAGDGTEKRLFVAGAKGDWVISQEAYEGKLGSVLRVISIDDGRIMAEHELPGLPIFDGVSAARGRLYLSLTSGRVLCLGRSPSTKRLHPGGASPGSPRASGRAAM